MSHYCLLHTQLITLTSADELPVVGDSCTGGARRCKVKQGCREDRPDVWILASKVVRFGGRVQRQSFPMQDEPERRTCFQHKMSLKD